ncbi:universal minicircle sequence binding protein [Artemisia annua]|uniref:Universal minicircle sequence binding protein n=1 Tax=Artemisia annua TaxID=35608 RepID=A0A2U1L3D9_ARTAN|nr:universal minicircle sequence binding protein [Artemisia annua]
MGDKNIFKSIREGRIIQTVLYKGIGEAAKNFDIPKSEVNEIVLKAIKGHQNMIKIHQNSIERLNKRMEESEERDRKTRLCQGNVCCYFCGENFHLAKDCSCFKCGKNGHLAKDCSGYAGRSGCYKCGQVGHRARKCNQVGSGGDCVCYNCGETGHIAWECSQCCSLCGKSGHMSKDCPELSCKCGEDGHYPYECPKNRWTRNEDRICCYICGGKHTAKNCSGVGCYKCSKVGHLGRDCGQVWGGGGGDGVCYYCGLRGYMAVCSLCGETGHLGDVMKLLCHIALREKSVSLLGYVLVDDCSYSD